MQSESLSVVIIEGPGASYPYLGELAETIPHLQIVGHMYTPESLWGQSRELLPDLFLINLEEDCAIPEWLEYLTQTMPHSAVLVCSACREPDFIIRVMQLGVREFLPLPLTQEALRAALERVRGKRRRSVVNDVAGGYLVAVSGHKGGVGTTAVAVNLAVILAKMYPQRVALVDLGRPFPDISSFLNLKPGPGLLDLAQNIERLDPTFVKGTLQTHEGKLAVLQGMPGYNELELLGAEGLVKIFGILRPLYDWLLVDLGHWLDEIYFSIMREAEVALVLTTLAIPELQNLKMRWTLWDERNLNINKIKIVVNRYSRDNGLGLRDLEVFQQHPVFCSLPHDYAGMVEAINQGMPFTTLFPRSKLNRGLEHLAAQLVNYCQPVSQETASRQGKRRRRFLIF